MRERNGPKRPENPREAEQLAIGLGITRRLRAEVNAPNGYFDTGDPDQDLFRDLCLTERDTAVPRHLLSDDASFGIEQDIRAMFASVFNGVAAEVEHRMGNDESHWVYVDAAADDTTTAIICTDETVLALYSTKPWRFYWESEHEMALTLGRVYEGAAARLLGERQRRTTYGTTRT